MVFLSPQAMLLVSEAARRGLGTMYGRHFVAFAELFSGSDHPVRKIEHGSFEQSGPVHAGLKSDLFHSNLFYFCQYLFTVIFSCFFVIPGVHFLFLWYNRLRTLRATQKKGIYSLERFFNAIFVENIYLGSVSSPFL